MLLIHRIPLKEKVPTAVNLIREKGKLTSGDLVEIFEVPGGLSRRTNLRGDQLVRPGNSMATKIWMFSAFIFLLCFVGPALSGFLAVKILKTF